MKKITLMITAALAVMSATAQDQISTGKTIRHTSGKSQQHMLQDPQQHRNGTISTTAILSEDFSGGIPATWQVVDNNASGEVWTFAFGPSGPSTGVNIPSDTIQSVSFANGFMMFDDDLYGNNGVPADADVITPAINCTGHNNVHISFTDYFKQYIAAEGKFYISNDGGSTWNLLLIVNTDTPNPHINDIDVTSYAANQADVRFKWNYIGDWDYWWQVDDISVFEPSNIDGAAIEVLTAPTGCMLGSAELVGITIRNAGVDTIKTYSLSFKVDAGAATTENISTAIPPGDTLLYTFTGTANLSAFGSHTVKGWISAATDGNPANDTAIFTTQSLSPIAINGVSSLTMGFEVADDLTGWSTLDANNDGEVWALAYNPAFSVAAHTGDYCLRVGNTGIDLDDWLFSHCVHLDAGTNYVIDYWTHLFSDNGNLDAFIGLANNPASMTQPIATAVGVVGTWIQTINTFNVSATGTYYVGLRANVGVGIFPGVVRVDDINLHIVTGVNDFTKETKWFDIYPNPASDNLTISMNRPYDNATVKVINTLGAVVKSFNAETSTKTIDISNLESGIYTVKVVFDGKEVNKRFTVSK